MKQQLYRYLKHVFRTLLVILIIGVITIIAMHGSFAYYTNPKATILDKEGPYVFYTNDSTISVNYIRGNKKEGFYLDKTIHSISDTISAYCHFPLENYDFQFHVNPVIESTKAVYNDNAPILAISDIESGFRTFRDFLIQNKVIDTKLNWTFGNGHLVLVGDFVDRGFSTTQVLWFCYMLEQRAKALGGMVHFIIGNHELYNLQGKYESASYKYSGVASVLGKQQHNLYDDNSFLGRWLTSKNTFESINGVLFTHGGIHPDIAKHNISISEVNQHYRNTYRKPYFPKTNQSSPEQLITHNRKGLCFFRGYFKDTLSQEEVALGIHHFNGTSVVVGHTIQWHVSKNYKGLVYGIDVKHPKDYEKNWPQKSSEGLLIKDHKFYRVYDTGEIEEL